MEILSLTIVAGYILDLIFGDPQWFPHPVRAIGWIIRKLEAFLAGCVPNKRLGGCLLSFIVIAGTFFFTLSIIKLGNFINPYLGFAISVFFIYTSLATRDLIVESTQVYKNLKTGVLETARRKLSLIVGRDTAGLKEKEIIRATVETVSENIVDGILSPLFYAFIGGAPLAMAYKAVNTLDSMVGYKNEKYIDFGWSSARLDDVINFIPARISSSLIAVSSFILGKRSGNSLKTAIRDGNKHPSPNSGYPEAAMAGALGVRLGGPSTYGGRLYVKPYIGKEENSMQPQLINEALAITFTSSILALLIGVCLRWII